MYKIKQGIMNIIKWFKVIWDDRDWDFYFVYVLLRYKLLNMERLFREDGIAVCSELQALEMLEVCAALTRLIDNRYTLEAYKDLDIEECKWELITEESPGGRLIIGTTMTKEQEEDYNKVREHAKVLADRDFDFVFDCMKLKLRGWWD